MVESRVETQVGEPIKEISPQAIKDRVQEYFGDVDLSQPGSFRNGLLTVDVSFLEDSFSYATAKINGIPVAGQSNNFDRARPHTVHWLSGENDHLPVGIILMTFEEEEEVEVSYGYLGRKLNENDPSDRLKIKKTMEILGVKPLSDSQG